MRLASTVGPAQPLVSKRLLAFFVVGVTIGALGLSHLVAATADASVRALRVRTGHTSASATAGTLANGTAKTAFWLPNTRASSTAVHVEVRRQSSGDSYRARAAVSRTGRVTIALVRHVNKKDKVLARKVLPGKLKKGKALWLEAQIGGRAEVVVRARAWVDGNRKPAWQVRKADSSSSRVERPGTVRVLVSGAKATKPKTMTVKYRAISVASSRFEGKPTASSTGVPKGTKLRVHKGDIIVTKSGTRIDSLDVRGFIFIKAPNVTITRSVIRGRANPGKAVGLVTNYGYKNLVVQDSLLKADQQSVYVDGLKGWNFTARRVHIVGNVDSIKIHGNNARIEDSLLEETTWFAKDPYQKGGPTHNDNIQVMRGKNVKIIGNTIRGAQNFAILGSANIGNTSGLTIEGNWLDGGHCTVKLQSLKSFKLKATLADNKFGPNRAVSYCAVQAEPQVSYKARNNVSEQTGKPIKIYRGR